MLNTMMENENMSFANILIPFVRSCSQHCQLCHCYVHSIVHGIEHDLRKGIKILAKLVFSFSIIVFNMMKLLIILFIMTFKEFVCFLLPIIVFPHARCFLYETLVSM